MDNVSAAAVIDPFHLTDVTDSMLINSTAQYSVGNSTFPGGGTGLSVNSSSNNVIVNNTIGGAVAPGQQYAFRGGAVVFYNSPNNRFENNLVQLFHDDGVDFHAPNASQKSSDNYAGKNTIISVARATSGTAAGSGMWSLCGSDRTWMFGNDTRGVPEAGIVIHNAVSNMVLGNTMHDNGLGFLITGGAETLPFCPVAAFQERPTNTFIVSNNAFWNISDQLYVRSADSTYISSNFMSPHNGFGGALRPETCATIFCQSALTFDTQGTTPATTGARVVANTNHDNNRGIYADDGKTTGLEVAYNRMIQSNLGLAHSRYNLPMASTTWDGGPNTGGNFWTLFGGSNGNPGNLPYGTSSAGDATKGVFDGSNNTGRIVDRFPYKSEDLGRSGVVTVFEPRTPAGASYAAGTKRTVRWYSPGCVYNDVLLDGTTALASNTPNTGYAIVTIPATSGSHNVVVTCKDSNGVQRGQGATGFFTVTPSTLQILAPGRDDIFNAGSTVKVAWKKASTITSVFVDLSLDN